MATRTRRRTVRAPQPEGAPAPNAVVSVELGEDEEVRWAWTHADGESVVTGYDIVEKDGDREELEV